MAGKVRHLLNRSGRYFARLVVPSDLRKAVGKTELRTSLGPDYRTALKLLPGAVADLQRQLAAAERTAAAAGERAVQLGRYPLTPAQIAASHYGQRMVLDDQLRNDPAYVTGYVDEQIVAMLRRAIAGSITNEELAALVGRQVEWFRQAGNLTAEPGSDEWRTIARAICAAEWEALSRSVERDEGDFTDQPEHPLIVEAEPITDAPAPISLSKLWDDYVAARVAAGFLKDGGRRQAPVIKSLRGFLKHNDAGRVARKDLLAWRDDLLTTLSAKTVNDIYLSAVRSLFGWAHENERVPENVAATVRQAKPRKMRSREPGYTDEEALTVLRASRSYEPRPDDGGRIRETDASVRAKRWVPLLCAFTGARVSEITQLRKEYVREEGDRWVVRITPDARTIKAGDFRDVPLHPQLISEEFATMVEGQPCEPLFHTETNPSRFAAGALSRSNKLAAWLREAKLRPDGVQPNHAWRHRFKSQGRTLGADPRVIDAIQGHAAKTAGDSYGGVSLAAKARVIDALPFFNLGNS